MTPFREWEAGRPFEMLSSGGKARFGVKLAPMTIQLPDQIHPEEEKHLAFMFDTYQLERINFNKKVDTPRVPDGGRLARTHDNKLIVVKEAGKGVFAGYYVNLTGTAILQKSDFRFLSIESGERRQEVDITLEVISTQTQKLTKSLEFLRECLLE